MQAMAILAIAALVGACATAAGPQPAPGAPQVGTYVGRLPCADCAGVDTRLTLFGPPDFRYRLEQSYSGGATSTSEGEYVILRGDAVDPDATVFQIGVEGETPFFQRITDDEIRLLDREQRPIVSGANLSLRRVR
ncbi:copper resistance protein NlpE N-terminal domain-containing protein [Phenylobacterium sp.]|uniref:copper resistance protein NlpE N-terminal domain-containing protein n=1 Tax=Phenylobacterium sp. TaxID=1871053 RepID=UPI0027344CC8|nr:copper resistance protein NlpE N-terminal domain-containing protein [Phenylobacterium sp.]MDP3659751.1 copper resistance protein NlpE N-terminal domain-containing protein [Phenylobacterium sp.]